MVRYNCERHQDRRKVAAFAVIAAAAAAASAAYLKPRKPFLDGRYTGQEWLNDMLRGRNERFRRMFGMKKFVFRSLVQELCENSGLENSRWITAEEQVAIFLRIVVSGSSNRELQERFQRGGATISHYFGIILNKLSGSFYRKYVKLPSSEVPNEIKNDSKYFPYFSDCIGAIDGSHFRARVSVEAMDRFRNRKGFISQNVLAACTFSLLFCYILSGWEGSAADGRVYKYARATDFTIPAGKYYLADAGFPGCDSLLVPYRGVRYHLKEWENASIKPCNAKELFNLRHAKLRNVVERIFGVDKRRFKILNMAPEYPMSSQAKLPPALCALHNFICLHDPSDTADDLNLVSTFTRNSSVVLLDSSEESDGDENGELGCRVTAAESRRAKARRDYIAEEMWRDYQNYHTN